MAHLWLRTEDGWGVLPLAGDGYSLAVPSGPLVGPAPPPGRTAPAEIRPVRAASDDTWAVILGPAAPSLTVDGVPIPAGLRVLEDRDEIRLSGARRLYFSRETLARVEPMPVGDRPFRCARCRQVIETGDAAVRCPSPGCSLWHHQSEELPCWTYAPTCAVCPQSTDLEAGFRFSPEEL